MAKSIIKEIIIILLLILAVILVLGVLLYEYVPFNKIIPETISYTTPENVKEELQTDSNIDDTQIVLTHQIDATDLSNYKIIQEYVPGKKNPFGELVVKDSSSESSSTTENSSSSEATTQNSGTTNTGTSSTSSTGYLPDKGTK